MSDGPHPRNWDDFLPWATWGGLDFSCLLVVIEKAVEGEWRTAFIALVLTIVIAAVALYSKIWLDRTHPSLAYLSAFAILMVILLSPFVEEKRWPFSVWFPSSPSADEIAKAIVQKLPALSDVRLKAASPSAASLPEASTPIGANLTKTECRVNPALTKKYTTYEKEQLSALINQVSTELSGARESADNLRGIDDYFFSGLFNKTTPQAIDSSMSPFMTKQATLSAILRTHEPKTQYSEEINYMICSTVDHMSKVYGTIRLAQQAIRTLQNIAPHPTEEVSNEAPQMFNIYRDNLKTELTDVNVSIADALTRTSSLRDALK